MLFTFLLTNLIVCSNWVSPKALKEEYTDIIDRIVSEKNTPISLKKSKFNSIKDTATDGGAIYINTNKVNCTIDDCHFNLCGGRNGGAIYITYSSSVYNFTVFDSTFTGCTATTNGGAIWISNTQYNKQSFNILRCTFSSNTAGSGGAIYGTVRDQLFIQNSNFINNDATTGSSLWVKLGYSSQVKGGEDDIMSISDCTFKFNPSNTKKINVHIENAAISNTTLYGSSTNINLGGCTFSSENSVEGMKHLEIEEKQGGIKTINFDKSNCVTQTEDTVTIPDSFKPINNFQFSCTPAENPDPPAEKTDPPSEKPDPPVVNPDPPTTEGEYTEITVRMVSEKDTPINIKKSKFINIKDAATDGGAIYISTNKVNCTIDDCKFESCEGKNGGAICTSYSGNADYIFIITDSTFTECKATNGGALHLTNVRFDYEQSFNIIRCTFTSNTATTSGGAIYGSIRDKLFVKNCNFVNNDAATASSIWIKFGWDNPPNTGENDTLVISDCTFKFNPSETNKINVHIENAAITNTTQDGPTTNVFFGGCTFSSENTVEGMKHLEIVENKGGFKTINFDKCNCVGQTEDTVTIPESFKPLYNFTFSCSSLDSCTPDDEQKPNITPDPQYPNSVTERYDDLNETINRENTEFYQINSGLNGGAIFVDKGRVSCTLNNCKFTYCKGKAGGAIYINYAGTASKYIGSITNTVFDHCTALTDGGAVYLLITQPKLHSFTFDKCRFISNSASQEGGAIFTRARDSLTIKNCHFEENVAKNEGSSIYCQAGWDASGDKGNTIVLTGNTFIFTPTESSINVYIETVTGSNKNVVLELGDCKFTTTTTSVTDFKHLQLEEKSTFESITFSGCNCVQHGFDTISVPNTAYPIDHFSFNCDPNGVCTPDDPIQPPPVEKPDAEGYTAHDRIVEDSSKEIDLTKIKFPNLDYSDVDGAGIYAVKVSCSLLNCKFNKCKARNGGAIYIKYTGSSNNYVGLIVKTLFSSCSATADGGAVYFDLSQRNRHSLTIDDCTFEYNEAEKRGGAIYASARDLFTVSNCKFEYNSATLNGSSIWCQVGYNTDKDLENNVVIVSNTFIFSPKEGSSNVYFKSYKYDASNEKHGANAVLTLSLSSFSAEMAKSSNYKHIYVDDSEGAFKAVNIPYCICVQQTSESVLLPTGVTADNIKYDCQNMNSCGADSEGYNVHDQMIDEDKVNVQDAKFVYHSNRGSRGGSISINKNKVSCTLTHCKFDTCRADYGGAVYIAYSGNTDTYVCTITNTVFTNCAAEIQGGALYVSITQAKRHSITVTGCTFTNNEAQNGGAVYADTRDQFSLTNCVFEDNTASVNGSSLNCRLGWNDRYTKNVVHIENNKFTFTPIKSSQKPYGSTNVYIRSYTLNNDVTPNANLIFGGNTFIAKESTITQYKHLNIEQYKSQFESIEFSGCSCVAQGNETVKLPTIYNSFNHFQFNCQNQESCTPAEAPTPKPTPDENGYIPSGKIIRYEFDPKLVLSKVKFANLVAENNVNGGAMFINCVSIKLSDCIFESCSSNLGGGIYLTYSRTNSNFTCYIYNTLFNNCQATNGAAVSFAINQPKRHYVTFEKNSFTNNIATKNGGALYGLARDCLRVQQCTFTNNVAVNGASIWCRVGQDQPSALDPNDRAVFYDNTFTFSPNVNNSVNVYIESNKLTEGKDPNSNVFIGRNTFTSVDSEYQEYNHLKIVEVGKFQSVQFNDCNCIQGSESTVSIAVSEKPNTDNLIYNCENINQCPAVEAPQLPTTDQCPKYSARQESFGQSISLEKTCFRDLIAPVSFDGGAVRISNAKFEAEKCYFTNCSSESNGGAIYVTFSTTGCELEVENCVFDSCYAGKQGGAIYFLNQVSSCESEFEGCKFINNVAAFGAGAFYYSPCANSEMKKNIFINNTCTASNAQGSSLYVYIENREINVFSKKKIKDDDDDDDKESKSVVIEGNRFRSEPVENTQQLYINLKKTGKLEFNSNAFSFNKQEEIPKNANYIYLSKDEGASFTVKDDICVDDKDSHFSGIDSDINVKTDCHTADSEHDSEMDIDNDGKGGKKKGPNVGMIVGIVVAVVVVVVVVIVVVFLVLRKKASGRYISDLNNDEFADNSTNQETEAPRDL